VVGAALDPLDDLPRLAHHGQTWIQFQNLRATTSPPGLGSEGVSHAMIALPIRIDEKVLSLAETDQLAEKHSSARSQLSFHGNHVTQRRIDDPNDFAARATRPIMSIALG